MRALARGIGEIAPDGDAKDALLELVAELQAAEAARANAGGGGAAISEPAGSARGQHLLRKMRLGVKFLHLERHLDDAAADEMSGLMIAPRRELTAGAAHPAALARAGTTKFGSLAPNASSRALLAAPADADVPEMLRPTRSQTTRA